MGFFEKMVKTMNRAVIASLYRFDAEDDKTGMGIATTHIEDKHNLLKVCWLG